MLISSSLGVENFDDFELWLHHSNSIIKLEFIGIVLYLY